MAAMTDAAPADSKRVSPPSPRWWTAVVWCLRITVAVQCLGVSRWTAYSGTPIFSFLWGDPEAGGLGWSEESALLVDQVAVWALILAAFFTTLRPCWPVLLPVSLWQLSLALATWYVGGTFMAHWSPPAQAVRIAAPLALAQLDPWPKRGPVSPGRVSAVMWMLRLAAAATFIGHGWKAWNWHPEFINYIIAAGNNLLGIDIAEDAAKAALQVIAIVDAVVALLLVSTRLRIVAGYMAFWGFVTAASRIVHGGFDVYHETIMRAANGGVPLALLLYWWLSLGDAPNAQEENEQTGLKT